jgi:hypothetical protein
LSDGGLPSGVFNETCFPSGNQQVKMPCLEIANQPIYVDGLTRYAKEMRRCIEIIADAPRLDSLYSGTSKDSKLWYFVQQWESLEAHRTWQKFPVYVELIDLLNEVRDLSRKPVSRHVQTEQDLPVYKEGQKMIVTGWKVLPSKQKQASAFARKYCEKTNSIFGWELEDPSYMYMVSVWDTVEERQRFHQSDDFLVLTPREEEFSEICEIQFKDMHRDL